MFTLMYFVMFTMLRVFAWLSQCRKFVVRSAYIVRKSHDCIKIFRKLGPGSLIWCESDATFMAAIFFLHHHFHRPLLSLSPDWTLTISSNHTHWRLPTIVHTHYLHSWFSGLVACRFFVQLFWLHFLVVWPRLSLANPNRDILKIVGDRNAIFSL